MKFASVACAVLLAGGFAGRAQAQPPAEAPGFNAGDFVARLGVAGVFPMNTDSGVQLIGGQVHANNSLQAEIDLSYFLSDAFSVQLIATSTRHEIDVKNSALGSRLDIGSTWVLPPALVLQWHPFPHAVISPYVGAGVDVAFFYDTSPSGPDIDKVRLSTAVGPVLDVGVDYNISGPFFLNVDYKQMFLRTDAHIHALGTVVLDAYDHLDPGVASVGVSYRF